MFADSFIGFIFLLLSSGVSASLPIFLGQILGAESSEFNTEWNFASTDNIYGVLSILAIILPLQAIFSFFRIITFHHVTHNTIKDIRKKAFEVLIKSPMAYFDTSKTGETISRISNDTEQIQETLTTTVAEFLRQVIIVIIGLVYIFIISPKLVLIMLAVIPLAAITAMLFGKFIKSFFKMLFYSITFQKKFRNKYLYRFLGILNSMLCLPASFRLKD